MGVGLLLKVFLHKKRGVSIRKAFRASTLVRKEPRKTIIDVQGPVIFTNYLSLKNTINKLQKEKNPIEVNLSKASVIDLTVQTKLKSIQLQFGEENFIITGLENHKSSSSFSESTKVL